MVMTVRGPGTDDDYDIVVRYLSYKGVVDFWNLMQFALVIIIIIMINDKNNQYDMDSTRTHIYVSSGRIDLGNHGIAWRQHPSLAFVRSEKIKKKKKKIRCA